MENIKIFLLIVFFGILTWLIMNIINMFNCVNNSTVKTSINIIQTPTPQPSTTKRVLISRPITTQPPTTKRVLISRPRTTQPPFTTPTILQNTSCVYLCPWKTGVA